MVAAGPRWVRAARATLLDRVEATSDWCRTCWSTTPALSTLGPAACRRPRRGDGNMVESDVMAVIDLCTRVLPGMVERGRGAILNVASAAAFQPLPGQAGYGASKAFVLSYTRSLGGKLRGTGMHRHHPVPRTGRHRVRRGCRLRQGRRRGQPPPVHVGRAGRGGGHGAAWMRWPRATPWRSPARPTEPAAMVRPPHAEAAPGPDPRQPPSRPARPLARRFASTVVGSIGRGVAVPVDIVDPAGPAVGCSSGTGLWRLAVRPHSQQAQLLADEVIGIRLR